MLGIESGEWDLTMDEEESDLEYHREIVRQGLALNEKYAEAGLAQEAALEQYEKAERADGRDPGFLLTDEQRAWDEHHERQSSFVALHKQDVLEQLNLDPKNSALYPDFGRLLENACNPESVIVYDTALREFGLMETWGSGDCFNRELSVYGKETAGIITRCLV